MPESSLARAVATPPRLRVVSAPEAIRPPAGVIAIGGQDVRVTLWGCEQWHAAHPNGGHLLGLEWPGVGVVEFEILPKKAGGDHPV